MDSGLLADGESPEDDYDVTQELGTDQILGVIDELFCFEVSCVHHRIEKVKPVIDRKPSDGILSRIPPRSDTLRVPVY